jgi:hypothetical protein
MNRVISLAKLTLIIPLAFAISSYSSIIAQNLLDYYYYTVPRVLVDASRDGGEWWYPQPFTEGIFDPNLAHQGKFLADYLRSQGMEVTELPRPFYITDELLENYHLVVRAGAFPPNDYSLEEIAAYQQYVAKGGQLILLAEFTSLGDPDLLAYGFGLDLEGAVPGIVDRFAEHPITHGVSPFLFDLGSALAGDPPPNTTELAFIGPETVMGILPYGFGQVFFIGESSEVVYAQQPLTENLFIYFLSFEGLASQVLLADLDQDAESGLLDKLEAAQASHDADNFIPMDNQLQAFINQVEALRQTGRLDSAIADQLIGVATNLMSTKLGISRLGCPCWVPEDLAALPMKKTTAECVSDGSRLDIVQLGECENSFGVNIGASGNLSCIANRFDCHQLPDLGGEFIETNEGEFVACMNQIVSRCEELGIEPPEYP